MKRSSCIISTALLALCMGSIAPLAAGTVDQPTDNSAGAAMPANRTMVRHYPIGDLLRADTADSPAQSLDKLVSILESSILQDTWKDNGGDVGDLGAACGVLTAVQSPAGQRAVGKFVDQLRAALAGPKHHDYSPLSEYTILHRPIRELRLKAARLDHAFDLLRQSSHAQIVVDWASLTAAGILPGSKVTLELWDTTLGDALDALSAAPHWFGYELQDGVIGIKAPDSLTPCLHDYDVRPLIDRCVHPPQPPGGLGPAAARATSVPGRAEAADAIVRLVEDAIVADSWSDNGGSRGALHEFGGILIVAQTQTNQRQVAALLNALSAATRPASHPTAPAPKTAPDTSKLDQIVDGPEHDSAGCHGCTHQADRGHGGYR